MSPYLARVEPHHGRTLHLRAHPLGMHAVAAVHHGVDARDGDLALVAHHHVHHGGNVGDEAAVRGDAEPLPLGQLLAPPRLLGGDLHDVPQPPRLDGVGLERLAVVPPRRRDLLARIDGARRADQLQEEVLRVLPQLLGHLGHERLGRPGVHDVVDRPEPADAHVALRLAALHADVGHVERRVDPAHAQLDVEGMLRIGRERGQDGGRRAAVAPGDHLVAGVEPGLEPVRRRGVVEAVAHVVLARPHHLHGRAAQLAGQQRRLDGEVALGLAAEPAAEQRRLQGDLGRRDAHRRGHVVAGAAGALHRRPDLPLAMAHARRRGRGLHGGVVEVRRVILTHDHPGRRGQGLVHIADVALDLAGLLDLGFEVLPERLGVVRLVRARRPR